MTKRIVRLAAAALLVVLGCLSVYAFFVEPNRLVVRRQLLALRGWPVALRIAAISDLHVGAPFIDVAKLDRIVEMTNAEHPDLIVLLGDYVTRGMVFGHYVAPEVIAGPLGRLRARYGVFAVLGNHDAFRDAPALRAAFEHVGIAMLEEEISPITTVEGKTIYILGLADSWSRYPHPERPLAKVPQGATVLALTHNPDSFRQVPERVVLTLAGHTHGGQVYLPLVGRPVIPSEEGQRYAIGHIEEAGHHLFVTSGIGTSMIAVRFRVPPEIALLDVTPAP